RLKSAALTSSTIMLAAESYANSLSTYEAAASEIHRSKISLHRAKAGYDYPTVRLPHQFSCLAGLTTRIYQTVHKGALAFLVVLAPADVSNGATGECKNDAACSKTSVFTRRRSPVRIRPGPLLYAIV
ncbi:MAG: hypothetical protein ACXV76_11295, partial [Halobacteriota archaeon]